MTFSNEKVNFFSFNSQQEHDFQNKLTIVENVGVSIK